MAVLRLTAIALVACAAASAEPTAGQPAPGQPAPGQLAAGQLAPGQLAAGATAAHPAGWRQLPAIAAAAAAAARADGVVVDSADAWGEPVRGCYAVWLALHGAAADAGALADQVLGGLGPLSPTDIVRPSAPDGTLTFRFARGPYRGSARAHLGGGRISAVACFANRREPPACDAACPRVLETVP